MTWLRLPRNVEEAAGAILLAACGIVLIALVGLAWIVATWPSG